jgi:hypothetical protein
VASAWDWDRGEGLLALGDPEAWDAAYASGRDHLGTAVIGLALNCPLEQVAPRILTAMRLPDAGQRGYAFTAAGHAARLNGELTSELYDALRAEGPRGIAENAIDDTLAFVPFRRLPPWFKWQYAISTVESWWLTVTYAAEDARQALRRSRS